MKLVATTDWIDRKMNQGSQHKIEEALKSYTIAKLADYRVKNLYMVRVANRKKYVYEIECTNPECERLVSFFNWMLYLIRREGTETVHLYFEYDIPASFKIDRCGMQLFDCQVVSADTFILKLYGDKLFKSSDDEEITEIDVEDKNEITEEIEEDEITQVCKSLLMIVERQNKIINELITLKEDLENVKSHANGMTPVVENKN